MPPPEEGDGSYGEYIVLTTGPDLLSDCLRAMDAAERERLRVTLLEPADVFPFAWGEYDALVEEARGRGEGDECSLHSVVAAAARETGATAIHHFVGAWMSAGPRCASKNGADGGGGGGDGGGESGSAGEGEASEHREDSEL